MFRKTGIAIVGLLIVTSSFALITFLPSPARALTGGPDAYGYTFNDAAPFVWVPAAGVIVADFPTNCQNVPGTPDFAFGNFNFYGIPFSDVIVCPNGFVKFTGAMSSGTTANSVLPHSNIPNADIVGLSSSGLDPTRVGSGKIYFEQQAAQSVITWDNVNITSIYQVQFQIILKDTGVINMQYNGIPSTFSTYGSGIENELGDMGLQYSSWSLPGRLLNGTNVEYVPPTPPVADTLTIVGEDYAPATAYQTDTVLMERYIMSTATGAVGIKEFAVGILGSVPDSQIRVRIYNDTNNNAVVDSGVDQTIMSSTIPTAGIARATFTTPKLVTTASPERWLIVIFCLCSAPPGDTFGVRASSAIPSVVVAGIDTVTYSPGSPIDSSITTIQFLPTSTMTFTFTDLAPANVMPGDLNVIMLGMRVEVDIREVYLSRINISLIGVPPSDLDIARVLLVADDNNDGAYTPLIDRTLYTTSFSTGVAYLYPGLTVLAGPANSVAMLVLFDISRYAVIGDTVGIDIAASTEVTTTSCNAQIAPSGFPATTSLSLIGPGTPNTVTITWTDLAPADVYQGDINVVMIGFTMGVDSRIARFGTSSWLNVTLTGIPPDSADIGFGPMGGVQLWEDIDNNGQLNIVTDMMLGGGWFSGGPPFDYIARIFLIGSGFELYAGIPRNFLISYSINTMARTGNSVGARIDNVSSISFDTYTVISPLNIPVQSTNSVIQANASDVLTATMVDLAPLTAAPFDQKVVMGSLDLAVPIGGGSNYVEIRSLSITRTGTSSDSDIFAVGVYHDINTNNILDSTDPFLGAAPFFSASAWISFDPMFGWNGFRVYGGIPQSLLLAIDISPTATVLNTVGLEITNPSSFNLDMMTGDTVSPAGFPLTTGILSIRGIPVIPTILSPYSFFAPSIDGTIAAGEWNDAIRLDLNTIMGNLLPTFLLVKNDATNLYIAYDVVGDWSLDFNDYAGISFDTDNDVIATDGREDIFNTGGWSDLYQNHRVYNASTSSWIVEDAPFDPGLPNHANLDLYRDFVATVPQPNPHPVIEFRIPLNLLGAVPGDTVGFAAGAPSGPSPGGVMDTGVFSQKMASWPLGFGPMMGSPTIEMYGDLTLGTPIPVDVTVNGTDKAPMVVLQGQTDIEMLALAMTSNVPMVTLNALNVTLTSTGSDADIGAVRLFDDVNDNEILDLGTDVQLGSTLTFTGGYANFTGLSKNIAMGTPERFLIVYDIDSAATNGVTVGARLPKPSTIVFAAGATVSGLFPFQSTNSLINSVPTASGLGVDGFLALTPDIMHIVTPPADPPLNWTYSDNDMHAQAEYKVQVWTGPSGTGTLMWDPPVGAGATTSVPYNGSPLVDGTTYYFRVNVTDGYEWSGWAEVEFRVNTPPPIPGLPISPPDDAVLPASALQTVSWGAVTDAEADTVQYTWQVEENGTCTFVTLMASGMTISNTSGSFATNVSSGYCWRVEADDGWESSGWSPDWNFTTTSGINNPPVLTLDTVSPLTGSIFTSFNYTVRYSDADGDSPAVGSPRAWIDKGGVGITGSPFSMNAGAWVGAPGDYAAGRDYYYEIQLAATGTDYTFHFTAMDIWGATDSTADTDAPDVVNTVPALDWVGSGDYTTDGLHPETGTTSTIFTFRVVYSDGDNETPASIDLVIEKPLGTSWGTIPMSWESWIGAPNDYIAGAVYTVLTAISPSGIDYVYYFNASDGSDWASGAPTNPTDAPDIDNIPVAVATVWPGLTGTRGTNFVFDAANSTDDNGIVTWLWEFGDGNTAATEKTNHTYTSARTFAVNLTVWDAIGQSDTVSLSITVTNLPPEAIAMVTPSTTGYVTTDFTFDASSSSDPDGSIVSYLWDFGDGTTSSNVISHHIFSQKQTFTVTLNVTDNDGATNETTLLIQISNRAPYIVSSSPSSASVTVRAGEKKMFHVIADDLDLDPLSFSWTVDGQTVGVTDSFYDFESKVLGGHTIRVTVSDGLESVSQSWIVEVLPEEFPWWLVALLAILIIVVALILLFLLLMKRKKSKEEAGKELPPPPPPEEQPQPTEGETSPPPTSEEPAKEPP